MSIPRPSPFVYQVTSCFSIGPSAASGLGNHLSQYYLWVEGVSRNKVTDFFSILSQVAYLLSGDSTTHHSGAHTSQHVHHQSSLDESTKQQPSDAGSEGTEAELVIVLEETPAGDNGEGKSENSHSSTQPPLEATTGQEKSSNGDNAKDEPREKAKQTGMIDIEEVKEVKENVEDKALPGNPEVHSAPQPPPRF